MSGPRIDLLVIDPQKDFIDTPGSPGSLAVGGAYQDMQHLAAFIKRAGTRLNDIHVTLDSHRTLDVAHAAWWRSPDTGDHPAPFTVITSADIKARKWMSVPQYPQGKPDALQYVEALEANHRYPLMIWPDHCLIGTPGYNIDDSVMGELLNWERSQIAQVDFVTKGSNPFTEHYSAVQAEVPDPTDPSTLPNMQLINLLKDCDQIVIAGEALSHCVANTVRDIAANFGDAEIKKLVLLTDASSNVYQCEALGDAFIREMTARGMQLSTTKDYMK